jgi:hypothetical protein
MYDWLRVVFNQDESSEIDWFGGGVNASVLVSGEIFTNWVKGKISIKFIFSCYESDSHKNIPGSPSRYTAIDENCVICIDLKAMEEHKIEPSVKQLGMEGNTFTQKKLVTSLRHRLSLTDINSYRYAWLDYGVPCKVSLPGLSKGWSKGRIYLEVGYQPDEIQDSEVQPESSLDDIRNAIEAN